MLLVLLLLVARASWSHVPSLALSTLLWVFPTLLDASLLQVSMLQGGLLLLLLRRSGAALAAAALVGS